MKVVVVSGDGDALAIGGNHFIHAARRNIDITLILVNNSIYGMTGGQVAPTTPIGSNAHTTPYGNYEPPFNPVELAMSAAQHLLPAAPLMLLFKQPTSSKKP